MTTTAITRTPEQVVEDIRQRFDGLWNVLSQNPEQANELTSAFEEVLLLAGAHKHLEEVLGSKLAALIDMKAQRDEAIRQLQTNRAAWTRFAGRRALRDLAESIAAENDKDAKVILLALEYLTGDRENDAISMYTEHDAAEALAKLGKELEEN